ncbi:MAG: hypothetical protein N2449_00010 [Bacteroidales bacterium]|nr:hypothetical protein [Bacteroidales bacterium]
MKFIRNYFKRIEAKRYGIKDGNRRYPPSDFDGLDGKYSNYEKQLVQDATKEINNTVKTWKDEEEKNITQIKTLLPDLSISINKLKLELENTRNKYGQYVQVEQIKKFKFFSFLVFLFVFLLLGEIFVNIYSFKFLREPGITTIALGIVLTIIIPFSGILIGYQLRPKDKQFLGLIFGFVLLLLSLLIIYNIAKGREIALAQKVHDENVINTAFYIFLGMNIVFFVFSLKEGYKYSYTYLRIQNAYKDVNKRKRQFFNRINRLHDGLSKAVVKVRNAITHYNKFAIIYRDFNIKARGYSKDPLPQYFTKEFKLPIEINNEIARYLISENAHALYDDFLNEIKEVKLGYEKINEIDNIINS